MISSGSERRASHSFSLRLSYQHRILRQGGTTHIDSELLSDGLSEIDLLDLDDRRSDSPARVGRREGGMSTPEGLLEDSPLETSLFKGSVEFARLKT